MSNKIAEAYVEISAKLDRMDADLKAAREKFAKATTDMQTNAGKLETGMASLLSKIKEMRVLYAAVAGVIAGGFVLAIEKSITATADHLDQLDEMSVKTGVSVEMLTSLQLAAKQNGVEMENLATSIKMMYRTMNDANEGGKESGKMFRDLGVDIRDTKGNLKSGNDAFIDIADAISRIENPAQKSAIAMKIFGKAGTDMLPMLEGGREAIKGYIAEAQRLGIVFTSEDAKKAAAFNDVLDAFNSRFRTMGERIALEVLPPLTRLFSFLTGTQIPDFMEKKDVEKKVNEIQTILYKLKNGVQLSVKDDLTGWGTDVDKLKQKLLELGNQLKEVDDRIQKADNLKNTNKIKIPNENPPTEKKELPTWARDINDNEKLAEAAYKARLNIRGTGNLIDTSGYTFTEMQRQASDSLDEIRISLGDKLVAPFENMMLDLRGQWADTIHSWMSGATTFGEFMDGMFKSVLDSFLYTVSQMAAKKLTASLFGDITGLTLESASTFALSKAPAGSITNISINAVDTQSFAQAVRRNPDAVISVVQEAKMYGRAAL